MKWGPTGETVYTRTYSRPKPDGSKETWPETVNRVVDGNLSLVDPKHIEPGEREDLIKFMTDFKILPAGRHLWASGVKGRQYLFNCHIAPWDAKRPERHFSFVFLRLMEGGGVGSNYSDDRLNGYPDIANVLDIHIVCDPEHADYPALKEAGLLSTTYTPDWVGAYEVEDSREGWSTSLEHLIKDAYNWDLRHRARVFDVSRVRPSGARLKAFGGRASGPVPLARMLKTTAEIFNRRGRYHGALTGMDAMEIDHAIAECVVSGGVRRSARMAMKSWKDPDILDFIHCKVDSGKHWTTNISVIVDNEFSAALRDEKHALNAHANMVMDETVNGMLVNGEPGFFNIDLAQEGEVDPIEATNPCGEIPGPQMMACCLGHVNMQAFVRLDGSVDRRGLDKAHRLVTRFLIRATFGDFTDAEQLAVMRRERRIGVGHFGVQGHLNLRGIRYTDAPYSVYPRELEDLYDVVRDEARGYAFSLRIPEPIKVTTVAPTGSIAKLPGVPEGDQAIYGRYFKRRIRFSAVDPEQMAQVKAYEAEGYLVEDCVYAANTKVVTIPTKDTLVAEMEARGLDSDIVESQDQISAAESIAFQAMYQTCYADNAISHTVNITEGSITASELRETLIKYLPQLKGTTIMVDSSRPQSPYERITREEYEAATVKGIADSIDLECATGACPIR
ncbi:ribonucleoside-triphosphate reductase, adenosylcobalamin-dependent [Streptomyces cadmiisoli]|uniref:ribonucleoside-triphosphate reductase, adenosylcobalamin-dependent n=1 Tax=Streptomyces cadmiisoli TaxID=2184053 RepID=UPI001FE6BAAF|nr:ribonucleoside-triphosphate reductase, adenosylcobalamin-dependent [Streptomyces cadmiisoli]